MTTEQAIERISEILNNTGAHAEIARLAMECGVNELAIENLATNIEEEIAGQMIWAVPRTASRSEERCWEDMATHNERFCD